MRLLLEMSHPAPSIDKKKRRARCSFLPSETFRRFYARHGPFCGITVVYWALFLLCFDLRVPRPDALGYYSYAQSLLFDGDLSLFNELTGWGIDPRFVEQTRLGHLVNYFACGAALLWIPFVATLHLALVAAKAFGSSVVVDGYSNLYLGAAAIASAVYGYLSVVLSYHIAQRYVSKGIAAWATIAMTLFSPLWYYVSVEGTMSHAASAFTATLFLYFLPYEPSLANVRNGDSLCRWFVLGCVGGALSMVRWQDSLLPACVGLGLFVDTVKRAYLSSRAAVDRRRPLLICGPLLVYALALVLSFSPQLAIWQMQTGQPLVVPQGKQFFTFLRPALGQVLWSPNHSLFGWTPIVIPAVLGGIPLLWQRNRKIALLMVSFFVLEVYVNSIVIDPSAGASFGGRRFLGLFAFFVLGLAVVCARVPSLLASIMIGVCGIWTTALWLAFVHGWIDPIRFQSYGELVSSFARLRDFVPKHFALLQPRHWHLADASLWLWISIGPLCAIIVGSAIWIAARLPHTATEVPRATALASAVLLTLFVGGVAIAALRSEPMPVPWVAIGRHHLMLNFGWYANARSDGNPFQTQAQSLGDFRLPDRLHWGTTPFVILPETQGTNAAASSLTTCTLPMQHFTVPLAPLPTRAIHFALCGLGATEHDLPVLTVRVDTERTGKLERTLRAGQDIWDFFTVPPPPSRVYESAASVSGFTFSIPGAPVAKQVEISSPWSSAKVWPCAAIFAITQEIATGVDGSSSDFLPVDLTPVANADYGQNAFWPSPVLNYYPSLTPGLLQLESNPFLILSRRHTPHGANVLNIKPFGPSGIRLPLPRQRAERLSLLAAVLDNGESNHHVADLVVEYEDGQRSTRELSSPTDVVAYMRHAAEPNVAWTSEAGQKLSSVTMDLGGKAPKYLWLLDRANTECAACNSSVTVFAITQTLAAPYQAENSSGD